MLPIDPHSASIPVSIGVPIKCDEPNVITNAAFPLLLQVRGEINLACCWRVTPQDVLTLRVRNLAAEVSQREEMLAVLAERTGQEAAESSLPELAASSSSQAQWPASMQLAQLKMARTSRGRLGVKVLFWSCFPLS